MEILKWRKPVTFIFLSMILLSQAFGASDFSISSLSQKRERVKGDKYFFLTAVYRSSLKKASDVEIKFYALLKKGSKETLARGNQSFSEVKKGKHEEVMVIKPSSVESYGRVKKIRVEIWHDEELVVSKTKPSGKDKWWKQEKSKSIIEPGEDVLKLVEEIKRLD